MKTRVHRKHRKRNKPQKACRILVLCIALVVLLAGIGLVAYPQLEQKWALDEQDRLLESMMSRSGTILLDPMVARAAELDFYDEPEDVGYQPPAELAAENEATPDIITGIGILSIEKIGLKLPVVDGVSRKQLKIALGRVPQTAQIGAVGNAVIAGHRSYAYGKYFNRLGELEKGDIISYQPKDGAPLRFEVYEIRTIRPGDQSAFVQPTDFSEITLYTCTPVRIASHRLLIHAKLATK